MILESEVGSALAYLHGRRYQHRDVKSSNVFLLNRSIQEPIAKLGDFASCRVYESGGLQTPGHTVGTPGYMAPEMARDEPYDQSADIFSFGLLLYELIAQKRAWNIEDLSNHLTGSEWSVPPRSFSNWSVLGTHPEFFRALSFRPIL